MAAIMPGCRSLQVTRPGRLLEPLWVPRTRSRPRDLRILVYETAGAVSTHWPDGSCGGRGSVAGGRLLSG
jgi:hypothetical protein